jgi:hypothetical protein
MQDPKNAQIEAILASADGSARATPPPALEAKILRRLAAEMAARPEVVTVGYRLRIAAVVALLVVNTATLLYFLQPTAPKEAQQAVQDYWSYTQDTRF